MEAVKRNRAELLRQMAEQERFLRSSIKAFDDGDNAEAKRLAVSIRVLVHDSRTSHSLLHQLGVLERLSWLDTAGEVSTFDVSPTLGLVVVQSRITSLGLDEYRYVAPSSPLPAGAIRAPEIRITDVGPAGGPIEERPRRERGGQVPFATWWETPVMRDTNGENFSRRRLVLNVANKDGGSHVDPAIPLADQRLWQQGSLGIYRPQNDGRPSTLIDTNPALPAIRQIAEEVLLTIRANGGTL